MLRMPTVNSYLGKPKMRCVWAAILASAIISSTIPPYNKLYDVLVHHFFSFRRK